MARQNKIIPPPPWPKVFRQLADKQNERAFFDDSFSGRFFGGGAHFSALPAQRSMKKKSALYRTAWTIRSIPVSKVFISVHQQESAAKSTG
jgi:hypothetical protein